MRIPKLHLVVVLLGIFTCGLYGEAGAGEAVGEAIAIIHPAAGEKVAGELHLKPAADGLSITGTFKDLEPGSHGFHVHRYGNCTAPNEGSVGPHFKPMASGDSYHGDLPNVEAGSDGRAEYKAVVKTLSFTGEYSVIGRGLVIHGLKGKKIGCGVIGIAEQQ